MDTAAQARWLLDAVVGAVPLSAAVFDREMRYLAHNGSWIAAHGYQCDGDLRGRSHYEVFPEITEDWRSIHRRCMEGSTERRELDVFERADGGREYLRWVVSPWRKAEHEIGGIIIFVENITEQVITQRRLQEREALVDDLFQKSPVGLNLCRMDGLWVESNPAFLDIIGYNREEADGGLTYWQLTPRKYDADEAQQLERLRTTHHYGPYEKEFIRKDGKHVPVRLNGFLVEREGETYIWSLIEDLTAQRTLEVAVDQERVKAIQATKLATLGEMAAGIAHEINNPLGIIDAFAFVARDAVARGDATAAHEALEVIRDATERAGKIVHGLKRFARQSTDDTELVDVGKLVEDTLTLWRTRMRSDAAELSVSVEQDACVQARPVELGQVLVNLLNNAFDAARKSDDRWIDLTVAFDASDVVISVEDSGPPILPTVASEMFRAFFTTKPAGEGTGLGLSISREIIERHGGSLVLAAEVANTRFVVRIPRVDR